MESQSNLSNYGSPLWEHLIWCLKMQHTKPLDPIPIRNLMIDKEKQRIIKENISPQNRLFDLGNHEIFLQRNLIVDTTSQRLGQQDSKDFFVCLAENRKQ